MSWDHLFDAALLLFGVACLLTAIYFGGVWIKYRAEPRAKTTKAKDIDISHHKSLTVIDTAAFKEKIEAIKGLSPAAQAEALKSLLLREMAQARDWRVFLGGAGEGSILHSVLRTIAVSDTVLDELRQTKLWPQVEPLLRQLLKKTGADMASAPRAIAPPRAPPPKTSIGWFRKGK